MQNKTHRTRQLTVLRIRTTQKITSRLQKISAGKVIDNEVFQADFLNLGVELFFE